MDKFGILSNNIVATNQSVPIRGLILIENGIICDLVPISDQMNAEQVSVLYQDIEIMDFSDLYVSPGLIDLNVSTNGEWEGREYATKAAISGGTTIICQHPSHFDLEENQDELYWDVGKIALVTDGNVDILDSEPDPNILAYKAYLHKPSMQSGKFSKLEDWVEKFAAHGIPLFLDINMPDERSMYGASPCHNEPLSRRKNWDSEVEHFAGGISYDLVESSSSDEETAPDSAVKLEPQTPVIILTKEENPGHSSKKTEIPVVSRRQGRRKTDQQARKRSKSGEALPRKLVDPFFNSQYKEIRNHQLTVGVMAQKEMAGFRGAGVTVFDKNKKKDEGIISSPIFKWATNIDSMPQIDEVKEETQPIARQTFGGRQTLGHTTSMPAPRPNIQVKIPVRSQTIENAPVLSLRDRLKTVKPGLSIRTKITAPKPVVQNLYIDHLTNCTEYWETTGVEYLLNISNLNQIKLHICGVSSAMALSKIRKYQKRREITITTEILSPMLYFRDVDVEPGNTYLKNIPPIRSQVNSNMLWDCLKILAIDCVTSGHFPVAPEYKFRNDGQFRRAVGGINCLGYSLQSLWTRLKMPLLQGTRTYQHYIIRMFKWLSEIPAQILGISDTRGIIKIGAQADLVIWDPEEIHKVSSSYSKYPETCPFIGHELRGVVYKVFLRGKLAFDEGKFHQHGQEIQRNS